MRLRRAADTSPSPVADDTRGAAERQWQLVAEALESVPVGILIEDANGTRVVANTRGSAPFGDLTGDTLVDVAVSRAMARARTGSPVSETVNVAGTLPRRAEVTVTPLASGGTVAVVVDSTERLRLDAVRRDFVANVNHELRTPIGALTVLAEALVGETEPATVERLAGRIVAEAARARALIEDLLDFARVEGGEQPEHTELVIAEVIEAAAARVATAADGAHVELRVDADPALRVVGDREQLTVAVANLVDNAIKYSDEADAIDITARPSDDRAYAEIAVRDRGIGIPARDLERIFERFYRVDQARDRRTGGTGLGLAIVRHVAANHGGDVTVTSREGEGSTFLLRIPLENR